MAASLTETCDTQLTIEQGNAIVDGVFKKYVDLHYEVQAMLPEDKRQPAFPKYRICETLPECARTISWIEDRMTPLRNQKSELEENTVAKIQQATQRLLNKAATYNIQY